MHQWFFSQTFSFLKVYISTRLREASLRSASDLETSFSVTGGGSVNWLMGRREKETVSAIAGAKTRLLLLSFPGVQNVDQRNVQFVHSLGRTCHSNPNVCMNTKTHRRREKKERAWEEGRGREEKEWNKESGMVDEGSRKLGWCECMPA